ncbi:MAG: T9SS type A sorting domain-containing protein [Candidatus Neomarinimicrobiota bacterium]
MIKYSAIAFLLLSIQVIRAQNTVCFDITANPNANSTAFSSFTKYIHVLDCFSIYAESSIPDEKVLHVASVAAELLDNDEDGAVDDPLLKTELASNNALIPIFAYDGSPAMDNFFDHYDGEGAAAVLWRNEIDPNNPGYWGADATVEEVVHVINAIGHTNIYPSAFSVEPNSSLLTTAMDVARGGQFIQHPNNYPPEAWYHYDDYTCDYECMAIEYLYWCIVTNMGILADAATCMGIANEWEPCTPALFEQTDILMYSLITDSTYLIPQLAPDGNYCPASTNVVANNILYPNGFQLHAAYPNPFNPVTAIPYEAPIGGQLTIGIYDLRGKLVRTLINDKQSVSPGIVYWNGKSDNEKPLPSGVYFYRLSAVNYTATRKIVLLK